MRSIEGEGDREARSLQLPPADPITHPQCLSAPLDAYARPSTLTRPRRSRFLTSPARNTREVALDRLTHRIRLGFHRTQQRLQLGAQFVDLIEQ
jgi:hypothetical protein